MPMNKLKNSKVQKDKFNQKGCWSYFNVPPFAAKRLKEQTLAGHNI